MAVSTSMIAMFLMGSAGDRRFPKFDGIVSIQQPVGESDIPGLDVFRGSIPELHLAKGGEYWADCLTPALSHLPLVVSERVLASIQKHSLTGLESMEVMCISNRSPKLERVKHGKYFQITPTGSFSRIKYRIYERVDGEYVFRFETDDKINDPRCQQFFRPDGFVPHIQRVPIDSMPQLDFMKVPETINGILVFGMFFCSRRVVEIARMEEWTNFNFSPIDRLGTCAGDFRDRPWPPELWYPENHPPHS